jgi:regulatory protein
VRRDLSAQARSAPPPLDGARLEALALAYVGRYATTRAKLAAYLRRKLAKAGWAGDDPPPIDALVERMAERRYVDDRAFAEARGAALLRRGYGQRRIGEALRAAGVSEEDGADSRTAAEAGALEAALAFARRKRIGPFAAAPGDRDAVRRALASLLRAGHAFDLARRIASAQPGEPIEPL